MKRTPIYSRSSRKPRSDPAADRSATLAGGKSLQDAHTPGATKPETAHSTSAPPTRQAEPETLAQTPKTSHSPHATQASLATKSPHNARTVRHANIWLASLSVALTALCFLGYMSWQSPQKLTQKDIDAAVLHTLKTTVLPSPESRAFEKIRPSVVRVVQKTKSGTEEGKLRGVGTGVVIINNGTILTNLHVIQGGEDNLKVYFFDGTESEAVVLKRMPESDLAVIRAKKIPDDLLPATLRSTGGLMVGDRVMAVGFPFNIGPSASSGIVSGLKRVYDTPEKNEVLNNLIQFDAAANPGNSGGPLVTMDGEVVGIVTAILSPHEHGTFVGIGFAVPIETAASGAGESPF
jgi:S1-C subfamily serine protease